MFVRGVCLSLFLVIFAPVTADPFPRFRGRGEDWWMAGCLACYSRPFLGWGGRGCWRCGFGLLSNAFGELEEVEDDQWVGAADIAVGGSGESIRNDSTAGQFSDVDDAEGRLDSA